MQLGILSYLLDAFEASAKDLVSFSMGVSVFFLFSFCDSCFVAPTWKIEQETAKNNCPDAPMKRAPPRTVIFRPKLCGDPTSNWPLGVRRLSRKSTDALTAMANIIKTMMCDFRQSSYII